MEFNQNNRIVKLCLQGMELEEKGKSEEASGVFLQAWNEAADDFEKFLAAYYVARHQKSVADEIEWLETALQLALKIDSDYAKGVLSSLHSKIAECYEELGDFDSAKRNYESAESVKHKLSDTGPFYHGTRADLQVGDLLTAGFRSNYHQEVIMNHIYFTALIDGAGLAAELAKGNGSERVYIIEPTGIFENDPNVTDKKFPGNPTRSYRTESPLKIVGEVTDWVRLTPEQLQQWREKLAANKGEIIN
jgi:tetratricopeptide (TPR) repeat protein